MHSMSDEDYNKKLTISSLPFFKFQVSSGWIPD